MRELPLVVSAFPQPTSHGLRSGERGEERVTKELTCIYA